MTAKYSLWKVMSSLVLALCLLGADRMPVVPGAPGVPGGMAPGSGMGVRGRVMSPNPFGGVLEPHAPPSTQPSFVQVFKLQYISPSRAGAVLSDIFGTSEWRFVPDDRTNSLIISGPSDNSNIKATLAELDRATDPVEMNIIPLTTVDGMQACEVLRGFVNNNQFQCNVEPDSRRVIVVAPANLFPAIRGAIEKLEQHPPAPQGEPDVRVTRLQRPVAPELLKDMIKLLGAQNVEFAYDRERNAVITSGSPEASERMSKLLQRLDLQLSSTSPPAPDTFATSRTDSFRARLVWLISNPAKQKDYSSPPADLKPVLDELAVNSIQDLSMVSQTIVPTQGADFSIMTHPGTAEVQFQCKVRGPQNLYEITLRVGERPQDPNQPGALQASSTIVDLRTELQVPMSHPIVLAVTPSSGQKTSAFVLEFLPAN